MALHLFLHMHAGIFLPSFISAIEEREGRLIYTPKTRQATPINSRNLRVWNDGRDNSIIYSSAKPKSTIIITTNAWPTATWKATLERAMTTPKMWTEGYVEFWKQLMEGNSTETLPSRHVNKRSAKSIPRCLNAFQQAMTFGAVVKRPWARPWNAAMGEALLVIPIQGSFQTSLEKRSGQAILPSFQGRVQ